jgi:hypothetical protein
MLIPQLKKNQTHWKWIIIAAHDALQGALVCALSRFEFAVGTGSLIAPQPRK